MPTVQTIIANGVSISVRTWLGDDARFPPVVLLAGTGATAQDWDTVATDLSADRRVHAVDVRGHGPSAWPGTYSIDLMAQDVIALLPKLARSIDVIGHSLGGLVACKAAAGSTAVRRLVLEDVGVPHPRPSAALARPDGRLDFDWAVVEQVRPEIDDPDPRWPQILADISAPTLVIGGGPSSFVPSTHVAELANCVEHGSRITIDAGHLIHATEPEQFVAAVRGHLDS
ncbi:MAG: putative hydrolase [Nocardioidaceae bacterium]|nr:putative hydrolase [Nocardioidaceae bacterium]